MQEQRKYGVAELRKVGEALFGNRWQTDLARALGLSSPRRVRQWLAGDRSIPVGIWDDLCTLLRQRQMTIDRVLDELDGENYKAAYNFEEFLKLLDAANTEA